MKRGLAVAALVAVGMCVAASFASAGARWTFKEVKWITPGFTSAGVVQYHDTAFAHVGPAGLADTSNWVSAERMVYAATGDSLTATAAAYWAFVSDTSATYTATLTALTVSTDVGGPGLTNNSTMAITNQAVTNSVDGGSSVLVTSGDKIVFYPINLGAHPPAVSSDEAGVLAFPIRCRVTAGTAGQGLAQARVYLVYQTDSPSN